jgi:7-cyano-7-deazaguanine synthase
MNDRSRVVVLLSGGMDSVAALYEARQCHEVAACLSFDYGAKHNARELPMAAFHCEKLGIEHVVVPLDFIAKHFVSALLQGGAEIPKGHYQEDSMKQTVVPFRNGILLAIAAGFAESRGAQGIVIAAHSGDHAIYPDCREDFMQSMASALRLGTYAEISLHRPFVHMSKAAIAARGHALGVDFDHTWSCYLGKELHCGECGTCVERREAFALAGIHDPTQYLAQTPLPPSPSHHRADCEI